MCGLGGRHPHNNGDDGERVVVGREADVLDGRVAAARVHVFKGVDGAASISEAIGGVGELGVPPGVA